MPGPPDAGCRSSTRLIRDINDQPERAHLLGSLLKGKSTGPRQPDPLESDPRGRSGRHQPRSVSRSFVDVLRSLGVATTVQRYPWSPSTGPAASLPPTPRREERSRVRRPICWVMVCAAGAASVFVAITPSGDRIGSWIRARGDGRDEHAYFRWLRRFRVDVGAGTQGHGAVRRTGSPAMPTTAGSVRRPSWATSMFSRAPVSRSAAITRRELPRGYGATRVSGRPSPGCGERCHHHHGLGHQGEDDGRRQGPHQQGRQGGHRRGEGHDLRRDRGADAGAWRGIARD